MSQWCTRQSSERLPTRFVRREFPWSRSLEDVSDEPDVVHGNHHVQTVEALLKFRHARGLFVCHDRRAHMSAPPRLGRILRYVAVDYNCLERLTEEYAIPQHLVRVIYNSVDTNRFLPRPPLPPHPQRALVFSNYAGPGTYLDAVQQACGLLNLPVDVVGSIAAQQRLCSRTAHRQVRSGVCQGPLCARSDGGWRRRGAR